MRRALEPERSPGGRGLPRWIEAPLAVLVLIVGAPLILALAIVVKATSRGPALFRQERVGRAGRPFTLLKLRSMRTAIPGDADAPASAVTAAGDRRITRVGRLLRATKLDELPSLWNVARGDMSLVGPRPEVPQYVDLEDARWRLALTARPGLTDPATLALRDEEELLARRAASAEEREHFYREEVLPYKLRLAGEYLRRRTPWSDVGVLLRTAWAIVRPGRRPPPDL